MLTSSEQEQPLAQISVVLNWLEEPKRRVPAGTGDYTVIGKTISYNRVLTRVVDGKSRASENVRL